MGDTAAPAVGPVLGLGEDPIRVLHAEDDPVFRRLAQRALGQEDRFVVEAARDGSEALERLREGDYDCVLSDHQMPGLTGLQLLQTIRGRDEDLPFILLTGRGSEEIASRAIGAGVTDYIQKQSGPDQFEVVAHRIERAVEARRRADAVARVHEWYETVLEHTRDIVSIVDEEMTFLWESPAVERVLGYDPGERVGTNGMTYVHPDDRNRLMEADPDGEGLTRVEFRARTADGDWKWLESVSTQEPVPEVGGYVAVTRDVSERKAWEHRLEVAESLFRNSPDVLFVVDVVGDGPSYRLRRVNDAARDHAGIPAEAIEGRTLADAFGEELRGQVAPDFQRCLEAGEAMTVETSLDHDILPPDWSMTLVPVDHPPDSEAHHRILGIARALSPQDPDPDLEAHATALSLTGEAIFVADVEDPSAPTLLQVNPALADLAGGTVDDWQGRDPTETVLAGTYEAHQAWQGCIRDGRERTYHTTPKDPHLPAEVETTIAPVQVDGEVVRVVGRVRSGKEADQEALRRRAPT